MSSPIAAHDADGARLLRRWTIGAVAFAALVRFRFLFQPLAPDEGGYLAIARAWGDGGALYTRFWVDRPQGMMYLYRLGDLFTGSGDGFLRILAIVSGTSGIVAAAWIGRRLSGRWQGGAVAAVFVSLLSCSPAIEGQTANGELLSAAFVVPAMAVTVAVVSGRLTRRWLFLAGGLAAVALSIKQSGYDGLIGTCLWFAVAWLLRWRDRKDLIIQFLWLMAGLATVLGLVFLHGTTFGWDAYWDANVGFRFRSRSAVSTPQWGRLGITTAITVGISITMLALAGWRIQRLRAAGRKVRDLFNPAGALAVCWLVGAGLALLTGGNYHRHYWITVAFPLGIVLALAATGGAPSSDEDVTPTPPRSWPMSPRQLVFASVVPLLVTGLFVAFPSLEQDARLHQNEKIAAWVKDHKGTTNGILLPICGSANYHIVAGQTPPYPYLWVDNVVAARDSIDKMVALLDDPNGPAFVARFQPTTDCDSTGRVDAAIKANFEPAATVDDVEVLRRR